MNRQMNRFLLIMLLCMIPFAADARRKKAKKAKEGQGVAHVLTHEQQAHFDAIYFDAIAMQQYGKTDQAFALMQRALEIDSLSAPALYFVSDVYRGMEKWNQSLFYMRRAVAADKGNNYWYRAGEGELLSRMGRYQEAIDCYKDLSDRFPKHSEPLYNLAELYLRLDSGRQCLDVLEKIEDVDGVSPQITLQKFYILQGLGRSDDAFAEYDKLIDRYPYELSYRIQKGDLQMKNGQIDKAKQTYDEAAKIDPDNAYVWVALSNYFSIVGDQEEADMLVQNALVNNNLDIQTKIDILTEYLKSALRKVAKGKDADSLDISLPGVDSLFITIEQMHPTAPEVYVLHADYLAAISNDSLATVQMRFACDLRPSEKQYWEKLLSYASTQKEMDKLLRLCDEIEALHPDMNSPYTMRAWVYYNQKKYEDVIRAYHGALERTEAKEVNWKSTLWGNIGDTYHLLGDMEKVYESYDQALKYNDKNYVVLNNYAYFLSTENRDLLKAESMASKVIKQYPDNATYLDTYAWILYQEGSYMLAKFYQKRAIDYCDPKEDNTTLYEHWHAILKALGEESEETEDDENENIEVEQ